MRREPRVALELAAGPPPHVLLVDDDADMRDTAGRLLRALGAAVHEADTGTAAIAAARAASFDLALIDQRLPDICGLDVARALGAERIGVPWILMSGWMDVPLAVEAMRHGAVDAVTRPFDVEAVVKPRLAAMMARRARIWPDLPPLAQLMAPHSAAERWACLVLRGCQSEHDLRTLHEWARFVGVSYSSLAEACRLIDVQPHDARDLTRVLRILFRSRGRIDHVEEQLDVRDQRTLNGLLGRAALTPRTSAALSLREFLQRQTFVDPRSSALDRILTLCS